MKNQTNILAFLLTALFVSLTACREARQGVVEAEQRDTLNQQKLDPTLQVIERKEQAVAERDSASKIEHLTEKKKSLNISKMSVVKNKKTEVFFEYSESPETGFDGNRVVKKIYFVERKTNKTLSVFETFKNNPYDNLKFYKKQHYNSEEYSCYAPYNLENEINIPSIFGNADEVLRHCPVVKVIGDSSHIAVLYFAFPRAGGYPNYLSTLYVFDLEGKKIFELKDAKKWIHEGGITLNTKYIAFGYDTFEGDDDYPISGSVVYDILNKNVIKISNNPHTQQDSYVVRGSLVLLCNPKYLEVYDFQSGIVHRKEQNPSDKVFRKFEKDSLYYQSIIIGENNMFVTLRDVNASTYQKEGFKSTKISKLHK